MAYSFVWDRTPSRVLPWEIFKIFQNICSEDFSLAYLQLVCIFFLGVLYHTESTSKNVRELSSLIFLVRGSIWINRLSSVCWFKWRFVIQKLYRFIQDRFSNTKKVRKKQYSYFNHILPVQEPNTGKRFRELVWIEEKYVSKK